jgi:hypothetical protein
LPCVSALIGALPTRVSFSGPEAQERDRGRGFSRFDNAAPMRAASVLLRFQHSLKWTSLVDVRRTNVLLQSNDYFSEPTHINCVASLAAFEAMAALREVRFSGELPTKNYRRFMLIGTV